MTKFKSVQWSDLALQFPQFGAIISENSEQIMHVNKFIGGLNILDNPGFKFPAILIPILSGLLQFIQSKQMAANSPAPDKDNPMASTMNTMNMVMPITSIFFCIMLPIGVGLYWVAGSLFAIIQQFVINKYMEGVDVEDLIRKNVEKQNKKKIKLGIDPNASMAELAKQNTKSIENVAESDTNSTKNNANAVKKNYEPSNYKKSTESYKAGSIAANANLLNNRNNDKGDKK